MDGVQSDKVEQGRSPIGLLGRYRIFKRMFWTLLQKRILGTF
jgi:hypothetical protein